MAKKKVVRKKSKKKAAKKVVRRKSPVKRKTVRKNALPKKVRATKRKIGLVLKNLILFVILALISFLLYSVSGKEVYQDFFYLLALILGFIALAFLIVLLILLFMRAFRK